jgi:hypothetical protein
MAKDAFSDERRSVKVIEKLVRKQRRLRYDECESFKKSKIRKG